MSFSHIQQSQLAHQRTIAFVLSIVLSLVIPKVLAAGPYAAFAVGAAGEKTQAGVYGVNHPTRCDRLLYANPSSAGTESRLDARLKDEVWTVVRSHAPVQADGSTPFQTEQTIDDLGGWAVTAGLRYAF